MMIAHRMSLTIVNYYFSLLAFLFILGNLSPVHASIPTETQKGWDWLRTQIQTDGTLINEGISLANALQNEAEVAHALKIDSALSVPLTVNNQITNNTLDSDIESLARKIITLAANGQTTDTQVAALLAKQNPDKGFGIVDDYQSDVLDTAWALLAFKAAHYTDNNVNQALNFVIAASHSDGSFGLDSSGTGEVYVTSYVLQALQAYSQSFAVSAPVSKAKLWLVSQQQAGGYSTTLDNVVASLALINTTTDATVYDTSLTTLRSSQSANGSWDDDPYLTALASTALYNAAQGPQAVTDTAIVNGTLVDANGLAVVGAQINVTVNGQSFVTQTNTAGYYRLANLPLGSATITLSKTGFDSVSAVATLSANSVMVVAPILYPTNTTPSIVSLRATVLDSTTDAALPGVQMNVGAQSAVSDATGLLSLSGLTAGSTTLHFTLAGYSAQDVQVVLTKGQNTVQVRLTPLTSGNALTGSVTDAATGNSIVGATIALTGVNPVLTNASGQFLISGITGTTFSAYVSAPGYTGKTLTITLNPAGNNALSIVLDKLLPSKVSITGFASAKNSYQAFEKAELTASVLNADSHAIDVTVRGIVLDFTGALVTEIQTKHSLGVNPLDIPFTLSANSTTDVPVNWYVKSSTPGTYTVIIRASDSTGKVLAESSQALTVLNTKAIGGGVVLDPPIAQVNTAQPIHMTANLANAGNQPITEAQAKVEVTLKHADPNGVPIQRVGVKSFFDGTPLNNPHGGIYDANGNLYVVNRNDRNVIKITPDGQSSIFVTISNILAPFLPVDLVFDHVGNLLVLSSNNTITKITSAGTQSVITTGIFPQTSIDVDQSDNIYVLSNGGYKRLIRIDKNGTQTVLLSNGLSIPADSVVDAAGNLFVTNNGDGSISKIDSSGKATQFVNGLNSPRGITLDAQGNFYIANNSANNIIKITPAGIKSVYAVGLLGPYGLRFAMNGDLYVSNNLNNSIAKVATNGTVTTFAKSLTTAPSGMRYDAAGNLYVAKDQTNLSTLDATNTVSTVNGSFNGIRGIATASNGDVYVASAYAGTISKVSNNVTSIAVSGLQGPYGVALDTASNLYVSESNTNHISVINSSGTKQLLAQSLVKTPIAVSTDSNGNQYYLDRNFLAKIDSNNVGSIVLNNLTYAMAFCIMPSGGYYVLENGTGKRYDANGVLLNSLPGLPGNNIALFGDNQGNVFMLNSGNKSIDKIDGNGLKTTFATLSNYAYNMTVTANGEFLVALTSGKIVKVSTSGVSSNFSVDSNYNSVLGMVADSSGKLFVGIPGNQIKVLDATGALIDTLIVQNNPYGLAINAANQLVIAETAAYRYATYDGQGKFISANYGFSSLKDLVWADNQLIFSDNAGRLYALDPSVPGKMPSLLASIAPEYMDWQNGLLYYASGNQVLSFDPTTKTSTLLYTDVQNGYSSTLAGIAVKANGSVSFASVNDARVVTINKNAQLLASYAGFAAPTSLEIINNSLYLNNPSKSNVLQFDLSTGSSTLFSSGLQLKSITGHNNSLYGISSSNSLYQVAANGVNTLLGSFKNNLSSLVFKGETLYALDAYQNAVFKVDHNNLIGFARGLGSPTDILIDQTDNSIYITDAQNATVLRYTSDGLSQYVDGLGTAYALAFDLQHNLVSIGQSGAIAKIDAAKNITFFNINSSSYESIVLNSTGTVFVTSGPRNALYQLNFPTVLTMPNEGSVVYTTTVNTPALSVDQQNIPLDFGYWTPSYGGDFDVKVTSTSNNISGSLNNSIHIGANASGIITASKTTLTPGNDLVNVTLAVTGADFTSLAKVDVANIKTIRPTVVFNSPASPFDQAGNKYVVQAGVVKKVSLDNQASDLLTLPGLLNNEPLTIDLQQNLYIASKGLKQLLRVDKTGNYTVVTALSVTPISLVADKDGIVYILFDQGILRVTPDGLSSIMGKGALGNPSNSQNVLPEYLSIDGANNLYVQNWGNIVNKLAPDGTVTNLLVPDPITGNLPFNFSLENEGVNIAGDCADNLFITPMTLDVNRISTEEHQVIEINGKTGQIMQVLDGFSIYPQITDMDSIYFDHAGNNLYVQYDGGNIIYQIPVKCGALDVALHVVLPANQSASGFSIAPSSQLALADGSTEYIWNMKDVTSLGQPVRFDTALTNLALGDNKPVAQSAFLSFNNSFAPGDVTVPLDIPSLTVVSPVNLGLSTDKNYYPANTDIQAALNLNNLQANAINASISLALLDAQGNPVVTLLTQSVLLPGNAAVNLASVLNTSTYIAGHYALKATVADAQGNLLAQDTTNLSLVSGNANAPLFSNQLSLDKTAYNPLDTISIVARAINQSPNSLLENLTISEMITDALGNVVYNDQQSIAQLLPNALQDKPFFYTTPQNTLPGHYTVQQTIAQADGSVLDSKTAGFDVLSVANSGVGLTGSLTLAKDKVISGDPVMLSLTINNQGNADVPSLPLTLSIVDPVNGVVLTTWNYSPALPKNSPFNAATTWTANTVTAQTPYLVIVSATLNGQAKGLAQSVLTVGPKVIDVVPVTLKVEQELTTPDSLLVLLTCQHGEEHYNGQTQAEGQENPTCINQRAATLDTVLNNLAVPHKIVTSVADFYSAFRSGLYTRYWLSGGADKLSNTVVKELREAINNGASLLVDGSYDSRDNLLNDVAGVSYRGHLEGNAANTSINITGSLLPASQNVLTRGQPIKYQVTTGTVEATFNTSLRCHDCDNDKDNHYSTLNNPAIIFNLYGRGHSITVGFDLPATLSDQGAVPAAWQSLLPTLLGVLQAGTPDSDNAGELGVLNTRITNATANQTVALAVLSHLPQGAQLLSTQPPAQLDNQSGALQWPLSLSSGQAQTLTINFRYPQIAGNYAVNSDVNVIKNAQSTLYGSFSIALPVSSALDTLTTSTLLNDLKALTFSGKQSQKDQQARNNAVNVLQLSLADLARNDFNTAIKHLLQALDYLSHIASKDLTRYRFSLDRWLQELEYRWLPSANAQNDYSDAEPAEH